MPEDPELNDDAASAGTASLGTTVQGNLGYLGGGLGITKDQQDWWKITLPSTGKLQLVIHTFATLNLNQNDGVGVPEGVTVFPTAAGGDWGTASSTPSRPTMALRKPIQLDLAAGSYYLRLVKLTGYWATSGARIPQRSTMSALRSSTARRRRGD